VSGISIQLKTPRTFDGDFAKAISNEKIQFCVIYEAHNYIAPLKKGFENYNTHFSIEWLT